MNDLDQTQIDLAIISIKEGFAMTNKLKELEMLVKALELNAMEKQEKIQLLTFKVNSLEEQFQFLLEFISNQTHHGVQFNRGENLADKK